MTLEDDRQWFSGESLDSLAAARRRPSRMPRNTEEIKPEYDVRLQVLAEGPLSGYRVLSADRLTWTSSRSRRRSRSHRPSRNRAGALRCRRSRPRARSCHRRLTFRFPRRQAKLIKKEGNMANVAKVVTVIGNSPESLPRPLTQPFRRPRRPCGESPAPT